MYYVYAIRSISIGIIYVGLTSNLERRIHEHNTGQNKSTKAYYPFVLLLKEARVEARKREKYLKSGVGKEFLKSLFK